MHTPPPLPDQTHCAPAAFRAALAELVEIGMSVARMLGRVAEREAACAEMPVPGGVLPVATTLAEAIEADRVSVAAGEARVRAVARAEAVAASFNQVSRAVRRTVLLAERLDRGWARPGGADGRHAMAQRQSARADAIARDAKERRPERLDSLDRLEDVGERPVDAIVREICRVLGVDPVRVRLARPSDAEACASPLGPRWPGGDGSPAGFGAAPRADSG